MPRSQDSCETTKKPGRPRDSGLARRRREEILECAIRHFAGQGYHDADLEHFAAELGCAKGTLYRYFPTKRALFEAAVDRVMNEVLDAKSEVPTGDVARDMASGLQRTLAFFDAHPDYVELLILERAVFRDRERPSFFEYVERSAHARNCIGDLREAMKAGRLRQMSPQSVFDVACTLLYGTIFTNYFARRTKSLEQQATEMIAILFNGILAPAEAANKRDTTSPDSRPRD